MLYKSPSNPPLFEKRRVEARTEGIPFEGSDFQLWTGSQISTVCKSPQLIARLRNWRSLAKSGTPSLLDCYGGEDEDMLENAALLQRYGSDFVYVFQGTNSIRHFGHTFRGRQMTKLNGNLKAKMLNLFNNCVRQVEPFYVQFNADFTTLHVCWERLALPLALDGAEGPQYILTYTQPLDDKLEILNSVFERSPIGMIAAAARIGDSNLSNAHVTLVNQRARELLKLGTIPEVMHTVEDLRNWIQHGAGWTLISEWTPADAGGRRTLKYTDKSANLDYMIIIEPAGRYVIFNIVPGN